MRCNQVVGRVCRLPRARVGTMNVDARGVGPCAAEERAQAWPALASTAIDFDRRIGAEQLRGEAAVAITQNGGAPASGEIAEKCETAALEPRAECEELHPAVDMRKAVELRRAPRFWVLDESIGRKEAFI